MTSSPLPMCHNLSRACEQQKRASDWMPLRGAEESSPGGETRGTGTLLKVELTCANAADERCPHGAGESQLCVRNRVVANSNLVGALGYLDAVMRLAASALPPHVGDGMYLGHPVVLLSSRKRLGRPP